MMGISAERPSVVEPVTSKRLQYIDLSRGLAVIWMIASHALGRAEIPPDHVLQWIRPHGWATYGFVMISGFSVALLFPWIENNAALIREKLWRRAFQIGAIAYVSKWLS